MSSRVMETVTNDSSTRPIELTKNILPITGGECIWLLPYRKNKSLLLSLKRGEERSLRRIRNPLYEELSDIAPEALVVPLPQSRLRVFLRGYNHTLLIVESTLQRKRNDGLRLEKRNLVKIKETRKQAKLTRAERSTEQKGVFRVRRPERIRNKRVILFDDIVTTGATLSEARKELLKAGASEVICVALAH